MLFVCLFFNSSSSLLIYSCIFSILFLRFCIIFIISILNSFSGSLLIFSSFIWTCVFLVCSYICAVLLSFHYFFKLIMFEVSFFQEKRIQGEFFLPFGFCPHKFGPVVLSALCRVWFVLAFGGRQWVFFLPLMGRTERGGNPVYWRLGLYFCLFCCLDEAPCYW